MTDLDYAVKAILDSAHQRVQAEITAAVADGADLYERVTAALSPPTDETAKLRRENAELKAQLKGKAMAVQPQPVVSAPSSGTATLAELKALVMALAQRLDTQPLGSMTLPQMTLSPVFHMPDQPPPTVNVYPPEPMLPVVNVTTPDVTVNVPEQAAPVVNVAAPIVNIEQPPEVKATTPQDVRVVEMVARRTSKKVKRNNLNLVTQIDGLEEDA